MIFIPTSGIRSCLTSHCFNFLLPVIFALAAGAEAGQSPREMRIYRGSTPVVDGMLADGEYDDAVAFSGMKGWMSQFNPTANPKDLSLKGWAKHDGESFYFAFQITDDVLYGIDTERWLPDENLKAHELTLEGFPWFGDGLELMINAAYRWSQEDEQDNAGDGTSWQVVCNLTKSRLGGVGKGGLLEGEERKNARAWPNHTAWIRSGAMQAVAKPAPEGGSYVIEWRIRAKPCLEVRPGEFWSPKLGIVPMGFNIGVQDLDQKHRGEGNFGHFNHEDWWAGQRDRRTWLKQWGTLIVHPTRKPQEIHVAQDGSDANPGTQEEPLETLEAARLAVRRRIAEGLDRDLLVVIHGGVYQLDHPLVLGPKDSGTQTHSITWAAYPAHEWPGQRTVLSGGRSITGWTEGKDHIWTIQLPNVAEGRWWFRDLFADGQRLQRARFPNVGFLRIKTISNGVQQFEFDRSLPEFDAAAANAELTVIQHWSICRGRIATSGTDGLKTTTPMGYIGHDTCTAGVGQAAFVEHALPFLNLAGEWFLEKATGTLYYKAAEGQDPNKMSFTAPRIEQLLIIEGTPATPVRNVHFRDIEFACTSWRLPPGGYRGIQAGHHGTIRTTEPTFALPVALQLRHWVGGSLERCRVHQCGASGLGLGAGCRGNTILACQFTDIGGNGVMIGWRPTRGYGSLGNDWPNPVLVPVGNEVANCLVRDCGVTAFGAVGIYNAFTQQTRIAHNQVNTMPYTGISVGFRWGTTPTTHRASLIEYNHIFDVMNVLADGGGIYTLGYQPQTILRGNLIHDVHRSKTAIGSPNNGFFIDHGSKGYHFEHNIVFDTAGEPLRFHKSEHTLHTWADNHLGVGPGDPDFSWHRAAMTGPLPAHRAKLTE